MRARYALYAAIKLNLHSRKSFKKKKNTKTFIFRETQPLRLRSCDNMLIWNRGKALLLISYVMLLAVKRFFLCLVSTTKTPPRHVPNFMRNIRMRPNLHFLFFKIKLEVWNTNKKLPHPVELFFNFSVFFTKNTVGHLQTSVANEHWHNSVVSCLLVSI